MNDDGKFDAEFAKARAKIQEASDAMHRFAEVCAEVLKCLPRGDRVSVDHPGPCFARCTEEIEQGDQLHYYEEGGEGFVRKALGEELVVGHALAPAREDGNGGMIVRFQPHAPSKPASTAPPKKGGDAAEPRADVGRGDVDDLPRPGTFWKHYTGLFVVEVLGVGGGLVEYRLCKTGLTLVLTSARFLRHFRRVRVRPVVEVSPVDGQFFTEDGIPEGCEYVFDSDGDLVRVADGAIWDDDCYEWHLDVDTANAEELYNVIVSGRSSDDILLLPVRSLRFEEVE